MTLRGDVEIATYKPHTNHKRSSVRSHTLAPTTIYDLSHSLCWRQLTDLGHISSVTYVCHPLWFVCGHRKRILTSPLRRSKNEDPQVCQTSISCHCLQPFPWRLGSLENHLMLQGETICQFFLKCFFSIVCFTSYSVLSI